MEWVSVEDRLPEDDTMCLVARTLIGDEPLIDYAYYEEGFQFPYTLIECDKYNDKYTDVTHWQPLPEPPK